LNDKILNAIDEELARLRQARAILTQSSQASKSARTPRSSAAANTKPRRTLSAKARRAIGDAQRKRWAEARARKKPASPAAAAQNESAAS
jgi:hypothetical protein